MTKKPISTRRARNILVHGDQADREHVLDELGKLATSEITDVLFWDAEGRVTLQSAADLSPRARAAIKKVKITPTAEGNQVEVELHSKDSALRLLAKHHGLLDQTGEQNKPSVIGVNIHGPTTTYEVIEDVDEKLDHGSDKGSPRAQGHEPEGTGTHERRERADDSRD